MSADKTIDIEELRAAISALLDHLCAGGKKKVELNKDYYWNLDDDQMYDVSGVPGDVSVGSLFDDWDSVQKIGNGSAVPVVLLLLKVAPLLRYIGKSVSESDLRASQPEAGPV